MQVFKLYQLEAHNLMALHHVVKFLIDFLVFLLGAGGEDVGGVSVRALAASVLLLVQSLWAKQEFLQLKPAFMEKCIR